MKKIYTIAMMMLALSLVSCNEKEDAINVPGVDVDGVFTTLEGISGYYYDSDIDEDAVILRMVIGNDDLSSTIRFTFSPDKHNVRVDLTERFVEMSDSFFYADLYLLDNSLIYLNDLDDFHQTGYAQVKLISGPCMVKDGSFEKVESKSDDIVANVRFEFHTSTINIKVDQDVTFKCVSEDDGEDGAEG